MVIAIVYIILIIIAFIVVVFRKLIWRFIKNTPEYINGLWKEVKEIESIKGLIVIAILMPILLCLFRFGFDVVRGKYDNKAPFDPNWFSFYGSYLGGLLGGIATLIAVVKTIKSNKEEQNQKDELEKQKETQESALIIYNDFDFALDNIIDFLLKFWEIHKTKTGIIEKPYKKLKNNKDISIYKACLVKLDQFYFDYDFVHTVAKLHDPSIGPKEIRQIGGIYGYLSNIKRSLEVSDKDSSSIIYRIAFSSMNHLIKLKENELPEDFSHNDFVITDEIEIENLMEKLKALAFKEQTQNHTHEN